jgi:peptidoglycan-N-acetylglucosamine deacetylase
MVDGNMDRHRRRVLVAVGGLLVTGTAGVLAGCSDSGRSPDAGQASTRPWETHPAQPKTAARLNHPAAGHVGRDGAVPSRPVYYIDEGPQTVALTIDDGPSPVYTPQVLRVLEKYGITATFSMVGRNVAYYPAIAREVASAGHVIANHTWSHANLAALPVAAMHEEVDRAAAEIHAATGRQPTLFRAPYGDWSTALLDYCATRQLTPLDWSVDPRDWARPGVSAIVANILRTTRAGSIILEHDGGGDRSETVAALRIVLPRLLDEGYQFRPA